MVFTRTVRSSGPLVVESKSTPICWSRWFVLSSHPILRRWTYDHACWFRTLFWRNGKTLTILQPKVNSRLFWIESGCIDHRWISKSEVLMLFWEYFHKKLNSSFFVSGTAPSALAVTRYVLVYCGRCLLQIEKILIAENFYVQQFRPRIHRSNSQTLGQWQSERQYVKFLDILEFIGQSTEATRSEWSEKSSQQNYGYDIWSKCIEFYLNYFLFSCRTNIHQIQRVKIVRSEWNRHS